MVFKIVGSVDEARLFCSGSFSKLVTTFVCLSWLAETYKLVNVVDDNQFLDQLAVEPAAKEFLKIFQGIVGSHFSIRDLCSYYSGLPYTYDVTQAELRGVEEGCSFKHHSILEEKSFLDICKHHITPIFPNQTKFHYSELAIIFLGYFIEHVSKLSMEELYQKYVLDQFNLKSSVFSRTKPSNVYVQDLSDRYDYPSIAILDHGYFCYSNGFFTTLADMQLLLTELLQNPVFIFMTDIKYARAASNRLMNGLSVELRQMGDDLLYGYEGLSYSGCNIWMYSTKNKQGYITFSNSEEDVYTEVYDKFGYTTFDSVPDHTQALYNNFLKSNSLKIETKFTPPEYQGIYKRVKINEKELDIPFTVGQDFIVIRNPDEVKYEVIYVNGNYHTRGKDNLPGTKVGLITSSTGRQYMHFDGTLYRRDY